MDARRFSTGLFLLTLIGITAFGGCVSKVQYDDAVAANLRCQAELENANRQLESARAANDRLSQEIAAYQAQLAARDTEITALNAANADLRAQLAALREEYAKLDRPLPPGPSGAILPAALDKALMDWAAQYPELVEYDRARGMVKLKTDLLFARGSDDISPEAKQTLAKFAEIIQGVTAAPFNIYVAGHTDDIPIRRPETLAKHPTNWHLSTNRAISVVEELFNNGVAQNRMGAMGFSKYHPVAPNAAGNRGNPLNRRVEIWIVPPERFLTTDAGVAAAETPEVPK